METDFLEFSELVHLLLLSAALEKPQGVVAADHPQCPPQLQLQATLPKQLSQ